MTDHTHDDERQLTFGCDACLQRVRPTVAVTDTEYDEASPTRRLTLRNNADLAAGRHPATLAPLEPDLGTCGGCAHHRALNYHNRVWHKCALHRLGISHSAASDIRVSWPACAKFQPLLTEGTR